MRKLLLRFTAHQDPETLLKIAARIEVIAFGLRKRAAGLQGRVSPPSGCDNCFRSRHPWMEN